MRDQTEELCDSLDAAVFSGDEFLIDSDAREKFREYIARWERGLKEHEEAAKEYEATNSVWGE